MVKAIRLGLLYTCILYFVLCILAGLEVVPFLHRAMVMVLLLFGLVVIVRYMVLLAAAIGEKCKKKRYASAPWMPLISIIVPAFNEENVIEASLTSLAKLDYPDYEIIVVDDGSSDGTVRIARQVETRFPQIPFRVISQSNSGKSWALNTGIAHAEGEVVVCVDADSRLDRNALQAGINYFRDQRVGAIGGFVDISNPDKLITRLQQLEYIMGLNFLRRGLSFFHMVTVVPGPIGMFRKEALYQVGGYNTSSDCFAEDADLTVRLLMHGWRVEGEVRMIAHTEAPDTLYRLLRQRYRWKRGVFQSWFDNLFMLVTSRCSHGILIAGILAFESFFFDVVNFGITLFALSSFFAFGEFNVIVWAFLVLMMLDLAAFLFANLEQGRLVYRFWLFVLSKISYAYVLQAWSVFALFDEWLSTKMGWDKRERIGEISISNET